MVTADVDLSALEVLLKEQHAKRPPLEKWQPPLSGDMDMRIARDGTWYHEGDPIRREALVKLFASVLRREQQDYFLVTPVEKWRIRVDDAPFVAVEITRITDPSGEPTLVFTSNVGDKIICDAQHPLRVVHAPVSAEPAPYLLVRDGLEALLSRNVFYSLVALAESSHDQGVEQLVVRSGGQMFSLGSL